MPSAFAFQKKAAPGAGAPMGGPNAAPPALPMMDHGGPPPGGAPAGGPSGADAGKGEAPIMVTCPKCGDSFDVVQALLQQGDKGAPPSGAPASSDGDGDEAA